MADYSKKVFYHDLYQKNITVQYLIMYLRGFPDCIFGDTIIECHVVFFLVKNVTIQLI